MIEEVRHTINRHPFRYLVVLSGLFGLVAGLSKATWQVSVETGQVLAGIVKYPVYNHRRQFF